MHSGSAFTDFFVRNYQIIAICLIVLAVLAIRIITSVKREKQTLVQKKRETIWNSTISRCRSEGSYKLTDREIARFSFSPMLRAFGILCESDEKGGCSAILKENSKKLVSRIENHADQEEKGYFAYILSFSDLSGLSKEESTDYIGFVKSLLGVRSVFCRENALKALYNLGDAKAVAEAVETLSADARLHNEKLLSDGMNSFRGDRKELAEELMDRFDRYDDHSQSAVITFFTVASFHDWDEMFKDRLERDDISTDQRCDILRLIIKAPSEEIKQLLIDILYEKGKAKDWQTAAVAALGLSCYKNDVSVVDALRYGITSPEWNVRMNCASSIVSISPPPEVIDGILDGDDAYAADALKFALNSKEQENSI